MTDLIYQLSTFIYYLFRIIPNQIFLYANPPKINRIFRSLNRFDRDYNFSNFADNPAQYRE
jgi:hypothetical protein